MVHFLISPTKTEHYSETEFLNRDAFWDLYAPGCVEHFLVHRLRRHADNVPELDLVACQNDTGKVLGNIVCSKARILGPDSQSTEALCVGPLAVLPEYQKQGLGTALMNAAIAAAKDLGYRAMVLYGNPAYYNRFGFVNAQTYEIQTSQGMNFDAFMVLELYPEGLKGVTGRFHESEAFAFGPEEAEEFDKAFPPREKHVTDTQLKH